VSLTAKNYYVITRRALAQAIPPIAIHFSVTWSVCLSSVVCHTLAPYRRI